MPIRSYVKENFETVTPQDEARAIKDKVARSGPVVVLDNGTFLGVLTADDLLRCKGDNVIECIAPKPHVMLNYSVKQTIDLMRQAGVCILPVFAAETFIGLIHYNDLVDHILNVIEDQNVIVQTIAHDLKSPIKSIMGLSSLLRQNVVKEDNIEYLNFVDQTLSYAVEIIDDLLFIPQIEGGGDEQKEYETVDVNRLLAECIGAVSGAASAKNISLINSLTNSSFCYSIHASKFKRAINNLLSNAIKFTPKGGVVEVSSEQNGNELRIKIRDTGIGLPLEYQHYLFQKFTKAKRTGTEGEKSIGLGLFITKQIIENHNGQLWFASNGYSGTTFYIKFLAPSD